MSRAKPALFLMLGWTALLWVLEIADSLSGNALDTFGIRPRELPELADIIPAAFLHFGFGHLAANTVPLFVLGFLAALRTGVRRFLAAVALITVVSGLGVWLTASPHSNTLGASGVVFGILGFLLTRGFTDRSLPDVLIGLGVAVLYGSLLWGVLPGAGDVSWQGHLFGLAGGVLAAFALRALPHRSARPAVSGVP
ncbi:rhomboid family intramembrane serine protease [Streptomyces sp. BBFR2]|uniref:rhomboid family intramembrane serine protease n=1 Tax=Streptomyces sp. BBFR2 TaxID=3372854 RepID=UPI0037DA452F